jgi:hypothetical protein
MIYKNAREVIFPTHLHKPLPLHFYYLIKPVLGGGIMRVVAQTTVLQIERGSVRGCNMQGEKAGLNSKQLANPKKWVT